MSDTAFGIVSLLVLVLFFLTGTEIAFAIGIIGFIGYASLVSFSGAMNTLAKDFYDTFASYGLTVIPLFVLMGQVAFHSGTARRMYDAATGVWVTYRGLAMTTVVGATVPAMCGSTLRPSWLFRHCGPRMVRYGYSKKLATGLVATVGTLGFLMPPSVLLIIIGLVTEQSIGRLFLAGIVPAVMLAFFFLGITYGWVKVYPEAAPRGERFIGRSALKRCLNSCGWS
jgi:TRAP-type C4-dicarboxylate transport system permease large subunit